MTEPLWSDERLNSALAEKNIAALINMRDDYEADRKRGHERAQFAFWQFHRALLEAYAKHFEEWARADDLAAKLEAAQTELHDLRIRVGMVQP